MAGASVEFLLENLKQLLLYHGHLLHDAKSSVEELERDMHLFNSFLKDYSTRKHPDESLKEFVRQIRDVCYEAEDVIDYFVTEAANDKSKNRFARAICGRPKRRQIQKEIAVIREKARNIYDRSKFDFAYDKEDATGAEDIFQREKVSIVREDNIVGFQDEAQTIINYLNEEKEELDVISIIGMPGLGKTTLAHKIFHDPKVDYEFPTRIWVNVSQEFNRKDVFLVILRNFTTIEDETPNG